MSPAVFEPHAGTAWPRLDGAVHVWRSPLVPPAATLARYRETLSAEEQARAARFVFDPHRDAFVAARGALRAILGRYMGLAPAAVALVAGEQGKPMLASGGLHFNVSHAGDWALVAVGDRPLGVDLEPVRPLSELPGMIRMVFDAGDVATLEAMPADARLEAFLSGWTRKEALVKAFGNGLTFGLPRLGVTFRPDEAPALTAIDGRPVAADSWSLRDLSFPGYRAALAVSGAMPAVRCREAHVVS